MNQNVTNNITFNIIPNGQINQNVVNPIIANGEGCRPFEYGEYVLLFQKVMGVMAENNEVKLLHWRIIGVMMSCMDRKGRIIVSKDTLAIKLGKASIRYIKDAIDQLLEWNIIYRPDGTLLDMYYFSMRLMYKGKVRDSFNPYAFPEIFPKKVILSGAEFGDCIENFENDKL